MVKSKDAPKTDLSISKPIYKKRKASFMPGLMTPQDQMSQQVRDKYSSTGEKETQPFYYARVLRVDSNRGKDAWNFFNWFESTPIRVRARIKDTELGAVSPLPKPKHQNDHNVIDMYPEFVGFLDDIGGTEPKVDDMIKVSFKNPNIKTKIYGNGIIVALGESVTKITEQEINESGQAQNSRSSTRSSFTKGDSPDRLSACESLKKSVETTVKPSFGGIIKGLLDDLTHSRTNPRQLNNPTDDQGIDPTTRQPTGDTSTSATPTAKERDPQPPGPNLVGHPPFEAAPRGSNSTPSSCVECDKIYTMRDFFGSGGRSETKEPNLTVPESTVKTAQPQNVPSVKHKLTNQLIKKLHPDIRKQAANFINDANRRGYNIKITCTYRTFEQQDKIFANGSSKAKGGQSYHNYGIAFDVVENPGRGVPFGFDESYPKNRWHEIGRIGKEHGFEWGGEFRGFFDGPHFQVGVRSTKELYQRVVANQVIEDPELPQVGPFDPKRPGGNRNFIYANLDGLRR
jgi:hypothetical protein